MCIPWLPAQTPCWVAQPQQRAGVIAEILLSVPAISIAGGTDEIQKNIIAERVLENA